MHMKKISIYLLVLFLILFFILALRPVPSLPELECEVTTGIVTDLFEGGEKDIVFRLRGDKRAFYINRGIEKGLILSDLQDRLSGKEVTFKYPKYWSPLDPASRAVHLSKVEFDGITIYAEFD